MSSETEKLLGILELYKNGNTIFIWNTDNQKYFNVWNLLISEGFVNSIKPEQAIKHWQNIEYWGTPTNQKTECIQYAPMRQEHKNRYWNPSLQRERVSYYQALVYFLNKSLQNLQAYTITGFANPESLNIQRFKHCIVLGQTSSQDWICIAPTVPDQVWQPYYRAKHPEIISLTSCQSGNVDTQEIVGKINKILARLKPIEIYGYYYGAYKYSYDSQLFCTSSSDLVKAIELTLEATTMLDVNGRLSLYADKDDWENNRDKISRFMNRYLKNRKCFTLSFWDVGCGYDLGCTPTGDWIGFKHSRVFEYNP